MRALILSSFFASFVLSAGCLPGLDNACGLTGGVPDETDLGAGQLSATRDGSPFAERATWSDGPNGSLDSGTLSIIITVDETGTSVPDLIGRRAFPICVPLGERGESSGQAIFDSNFVTDAGNTGNLSILDENGGMITGRFAVQLGDAGGGASTSFTDGIFRATQR